MTRRVRRNPPPLPSRVSVRDMLSAWRSYGPFARQAAIVAMQDAGWPPNDPDLMSALRAKTERPLIRLLDECGSPACALVSDVFQRKGDILGALVELGPMALPWYQQTLFAQWDACRDAQPMVRLLTMADARAGIELTTRLARLGLPLLPKSEPIPRRAIEVAEACARGEGDQAYADEAAGAANALYYQYAEESREGTGDARVLVIRAYAAGAAAYVAWAAGFTVAPANIKYAADHAGASVHSLARAFGSSGSNTEAGALREYAAMIRGVAACPELVP